MGLHKVLIIPGYGHRGPDGTIFKGETIGKVNQQDAMNIYRQSLEDNLELERVRFQTLEVGRIQKVHQSLRHKLIEPNTLVLHLRIGWFPATSKKEYNQSTIYYSSSRSNKLAEEILDCMHDWGHCIVHGHKCANPKNVRGKNYNFLQVDKTVAVMIEPFSLNGPHAETYLNGLNNLGRDLARAIANYGLVREKGIFSMPPSHFR